MAPSLRMVEVFLEMARHEALAFGRGLGGTRDDRLLEEHVH